MTKPIQERVTGGIQERATYGELQIELRLLIDHTRVLEDELSRLTAENRELRDVLEWSQQNCPGQCRGVIVDAIIAVGTK